ncbi:hypothetical protein [Nafulsella turpanensis]|uniref:hypothetical protein n=1 Tax=Nafulsella turpanensis TaxID=1265690 RepID=UPI0012684CBE|nr:hypothetical protein [Nafulsella turpanensis]
MRSIKIMLSTTAKVVPVLVIFSLLFISLPLKAQQDSTLLVVIDGELSSHKELAGLSWEEIESMDYLSGRDARSIYGLAGAGGALVVKIKEKRPELLVVKDGKVIPADSLKDIRFEKIEVLSPRQAINLYGPVGVNGALLVQGKEQEPKGETEAGVEETCRSGCCAVPAVEKE